jgi:hypothetical protein
MDSADRSDLRVALHRQAWARAALLVALVYLVAGLAFGSLAGSATSHQMRTTWRLLAWAVSAIAFAWQIWYEIFRLRSTRINAAIHITVAVALGAFGLAAAANIHAYRAGSAHKSSLAISLLAWPVLAGVPAFVVALLAAQALTGVRKRAGDRKL